MEDNKMQNWNSKEWFEHLKGLGHELEAITLEDLEVVKSEKGFIRCNFVVTNRISDTDGNWHAGAIASLIDNVGGAAVSSFVGHTKVSLDFSVSFYSTAKIQEEVEIEAKVIGDMGRITSVMTEVRRKGNGELIALGKQWMASSKISSTASKL